MFQSVFICCARLQKIRCEEHEPDVVYVAIDDGTDIRHHRGRDDPVWWGGVWNCKIEFGHTPI